MDYGRNQKMVFLTVGKTIDFEAEKNDVDVLETSDLEQQPKEVAGTL
jgi:hypothetical protein